MKAIKFFAAASLLLPVSAQALTAVEVTTAVEQGTEAAKVGRMIAEEIDKRDAGFGDSEVRLKMVLRNAHGETSTREMRNRIFEMEDPTVGDKTLLIFDNPRDVSGTAFLTFTKILEPDDQWLYLPSLRRVKRISSKNKSGPFMGSEFAYEDIGSQEVDKYTYKYLGRDDCGEPKPCFKIERYPEYEHSGYTRQVVWVDAERFIPIKMDFYDRRDAHMKTQTFEGYKQYLDQYWRAAAFKMVNHQNGKETDLIFEDYQFRTGLEEDDFHKAKLKRMR